MVALTLGNQMRPMAPAVALTLSMLTVSITGLSGCDGTKSPAVESRPAQTSTPETATRSQATGPKAGSVEREGEAGTNDHRADESPDTGPTATSPEGTPSSVEKSDPLPVYRPDDDRPPHDEAALKRVGIHRYASKRLVLYTDIPAEDAASLTLPVDQLYDALVDYFGPLPPARDGSEFQMTGYLMADADRFEAAGLLPDDLPPFHHGRHRGRRFWMREQDYDYYRRHLLLHEATHCFMTLLPGSVGPDWYMEGMAERFGTHRFPTSAGQAAKADTEDRVTFGIMPAAPDAVAGWGRLTLVRQYIADGEFRTLDDVFGLRSEEFLDNEGYAWSWAACHFLDTHPRYRDRFREMGDSAFRRRLGSEFFERFAADASDLNCEWALFAHTLRYGYDLQSAAIDFRPAGPIPPEGLPTTVEAARGWQSSGARVAAGSHLNLRAEGRFTLADDPKPWTSDAGGISFDYFEGRPIGRLIAAVLYDDPTAAPDPAAGLLSPVDIGREATFTAPAAGVLFLRLNDDWSRLDDNKGDVRVTIAPASR